MHPQTHILPASHHGPQSVRQRNAIRTAFRWRANSCPMLLYCIECGFSSEFPLVALTVKAPKTATLWCILPIFPAYWDFNIIHNFHKAHIYIRVTPLHFCDPNFDIFLVFSCVFRQFPAFSGLSFFLSFFLYILPDPLSSIIGRCTLYTPGCRMKAYK